MQVQGGDDDGRVAGHGGRMAPWLYGAVALGLAVAFAASVRAVLSPFLLYVLLLYLLWPLVSRQAYRRLAAAASVLFLLWVVATTGMLLAPFLLAGILAYILDPVVDALQRRKVPRTAAVGLLGLPLVGGLAFLAFVVAPAVAHQGSEFLSGVPGYLDVLARWADAARTWLIGLGLPGVDERSVPRLRDIDTEAIFLYLQNRRALLTEGGWQAVLGIGRGVGTVLTAIAYLVLLPILTFYLLRDWPKIRRAVTELVPVQQRERVVGFASRFDQLLSRYLRGQLLLAGIVGLVIWLGFTIVGFPYPLLLGLLAAVFNIVPYLGFAVTLVASLVIAVFSGAILSSLGKVAIVFAIEQVVEQIVGPTIVGESVGLHPVWVILALALFSFFFGFVGLLLAVPAAVFVKLVVENWTERYRGSTFYGGDARAADGRADRG